MRPLSSGPFRIDSGGAAYTFECPALERQHLRDRLTVALAIQAFGEADRNLRELGGLTVRALRKLF